MEEPNLLTGLGTRDQLLSALADAVELHGPPQTLAVFDIDGFNAYVEERGRIEGETLLARLAERLSRALGSGAACFRPRGDEFAALISAEKADHVALLDRAITELNNSFEPFGITLAYGFVRFPEEGLDLAEALTLADRRLYLHAPRRRVRKRRERRRNEDDFRELEAGRTSGEQPSRVSRSATTW
jgi:diguanylate cyclase (GGDEF)-like protein